MIFFVQQLRLKQSDNAYNKTNKLDTIIDKMWLIDRTVLFMDLLLSPVVLVSVLFLFETERLLSSTKGNQWP